MPSDKSPADLLYPDLEEELATTRRMLERVPDGNNDWKPHAKSYTLGGLASHIAELPAFANTILTTGGLDFATQKWAPVVLETTTERLAHFDALAAELKANVAKATWEQLGETWTLRAGDQVYMEDTKAKLLRTGGISHIAHHRAQLGVYLRQNDIAIPGAYGPSADEMGG